MVGIASVVAGQTFYVSNSCVGSSSSGGIVSATTYGTLTLTPSPTYSNNMDCSVIVYSGDVDRSVQLTFAAFSTEACCDQLSILDGGLLTSPQLADMSGSYKPGDAIR